MGPRGEHARTVTLADASHTCTSWWRFWRTCPASCGDGHLCTSCGVGYACDPRGNATWLPDGSWIASAVLADDRTGAAFTLRSRTFHYRLGDECIRFCWRVGIPGDCTFTSHPHATHSRHTLVPPLLITPSHHTCHYPAPASIRCFKFHRSQASRGYPISTFGELIALTVQSVVLIALILFFDWHVHPSKLAAGILAFGAVLYALVTRAPKVVLVGLQAISGAMLGVAILPQLSLNFRTRTCGWSRVSALLATGGNAVRVFTTLQLTKVSHQWQSVAKKHRP